MRELIWKLMKWILFQFDAERAHLFTLRLIRAGKRLGPGFLASISGGGTRVDAKATSSVVFGMPFSSRVGLAAGFDKNAEILDALPALGFGFAEIGTVTPRSQPGNDRPRLFREPSNEAIFNRMGFNSDGAEVVAKRLAGIRPLLPEVFRVGVNLGKNKETSAEDAAKDYLGACRPFKELADYLVVNVSSPNTPGLRALQSIEALRPIVFGLKKEIQDWNRRPPLLIKLAPELDQDYLARIVPELEREGVDGWVLTNTLAGTWDRAVSKSLHGGWSGKPLTEVSRENLRVVRALSRLPLISVGGIMDEEEALRRIELGADLIQIYSGWIYGGPGFVPRVVKKISQNRL